MKHWILNRVTTKSNYQGGFDLFFIGTNNLVCSGHPNVGIKTPLHSFKSRKEAKDYISKYWDLHLKYWN